VAGSPAWRCTCKSLKEYLPVQKAASFDFSATIEQLQSGKQ
jgi:hypothetical protein